MELSKLTVEYIDGFYGIPKEDGFIQKDKILPYMTIVYPYSGHYRIQIEDGPFQELAQGEGCYITMPFQRHTIVHCAAPGQSHMLPRWLRLCVSYDRALDATAWFRPPLFVKGEQAKPLLEAIDRLCAMNGPASAYNRLYTAQEDPGQLFAKLRIAGSVLESLLSVSAFQPVLPEVSEIFPACALVKSDFRLPLRVEDMAEACHLSVSSFYRSFRKYTGKTPMQYLGEYRLQQAAQLLTHSDQTLWQTARACGFCDEFHLSRNFKSFYGISPSQYRKQTQL